MCLPGQSPVILLKRETKLSCCMRKAETATGVAGLSLCLSPLPLCQTTSAVAITTCRLSVGSSTQCAHMRKHTKFDTMGACENWYLSHIQTHWSLAYTPKQAHIATCKDACTYMHTHSLSLSLSLPLSHTHTYTQTNASHTHAHTHTHTRSCTHTHTHFIPNFYAPL